MKSTTPWIVAAVIVLAGLAAWLYFSRPEPPPAPMQPAEPEPPAEEQIQHPLPEPAMPPEQLPEPLPPLDESDPAVTESLRELIGEAQIGLAEGLVRRLVATIDNLPRDKLAAKVRPIAPPPGQFLATASEDEPMMAEENYARYDALVALLTGIPPEELVAAYTRYYPLFQQAYEELGYPNRYFNDRLVAVIDDLLAAPEITGPVRLTRPHVLYQYDDPALEALSVGQKAMIRIGPQNAAKVKQTLRAFRAEVTGSQP